MQNGDLHWPRPERGLLFAYLLPVIVMLLESFPFQVRGFRSDGGSGDINHDVARLLEKLRIEFTRSRSRQTNDNALAECKDGAGTRKIYPPWLSFASAAETRPRPEGRSG